MKRIINFTRVFVALVIAMTFILMPSRAHALTPPLLPFGGYANWTWPCTCSFALWGYFTPLYLDSVPITGPMVYYPAATWLYANYLPTVPSVPHLGAYIPGVQACWMYAGYTCFPLYSIGVMAFVGTGL